MAKVLVTGATGFVGSALVRKLLDRGDEVHILARQKNPPYPNLQDLPVRAHHGDLQDGASVRAAMKGLDYVYHAAAVYQFYPWWRKSNPAIHKINIQGTRYVLAAARLEKIKKIVYTSSIITSGRRQDGGLSDEGTPFDRAQLSSHYAQSKFEAERLVWTGTGRPWKKAGRGDAIFYAAGNISRWRKFFRNSKRSQGCVHPLFRCLFL